MLSLQVSHSFQDAGRGDLALLFFFASLGCQVWGLNQHHFFLQVFLQVLPGILERMREGLINIPFFCRFFLQVSHSFQDAGQDLQNTFSFRLKNSDIVSSFFARPASWKACERINQHTFFCKFLPSLASWKECETCKKNLQKKVMLIKPSRILSRMPGAGTTLFFLQVSGAGWGGSINITFFCKFFCKPCPASWKECERA